MSKFLLSLNCIIRFPLIMFMTCCFHIFSAPGHVCGLLFHQIFKGLLYLTVYGMFELIFFTSTKCYFLKNFHGRKQKVPPVPG